jgi:hypothetical protein
MALRGHDRKWVTVGLYGACLLCTALAVFISTSYPDEGFYINAGARIAAGDIPYRDFAFFHMPGTAQLIAWMIPLVGSRLIAMRAAFAVLSMSSIVLLGKVLRHVRGEGAERSFLLLLVLNPFILTTLPTIAAYTAPIALALALCVTGVYHLHSRVGSLLLGVGLGLACAVRLLYIPIAAATILTLCFRGRVKSASLCAGAALGAFSILCAKTLAGLSGWKAAYYGVVESQLVRTHTTAYLAHVNPISNRLGLIGSLLAHVAAPVTLLWLARRAPTSHSIEFRGSMALVCGAAALHLLPTPAYLVYFPAIALSFLAIVSYRAADRPFKLSNVAWLGVAGLLLQNTAFMGTQRYPLLWVREAVDGLRHRNHYLEEVAATVAKLTPPNGKLWTFDTLVATEARRSLLPGLEMSYFGFYVPKAKDIATRHGVIDLARSKQLLDQKKADLVVASQLYTWTLFANDPASRLALWESICRNYERVDDFDVFHYSKIWIFRPKEGQNSLGQSPCCARKFANSGEGECYLDETGIEPARVLPPPLPRKHEDSGRSKSGSTQGQPEPHDAGERQIAL